MPITKAVILAVGLGIIACQVRAGEPSLASVLVSQTSSVDAIRSISCSVTYETTAYGRKEISRCEYWRSSEGERIKWTSNGVATDCILSDSKIVGISRQKDDAGKPFSLATIIARSGTLSIPVSPWRDLQCGFDSNRGPGAKPLRKLTEEMGADGAVQNDDFVRISGSKGRLTISVDSRRNYMICETDGNFDSKSHDGRIIVERRHDEVVGWKEVAAGIYLPEKVIRRKYSDGKLYETTAIAFANFKVNHNIDASIYKPRFDSETKVHDRILGQEYTVNSAGEQVGVASDLKMPGAVPLGGSTESVTIRRDATQEEPKRFGWWVLPAAASVLFASLSILYYRRTRSSCDD